jgi:hydroxymethylglutaryl-CoA lyase
MKEMRWPEQITIVEVGPRDGLQNEQAILSPDDKFELIWRLVDAGICNIEFGSFVHPKRVPQMADAEVVFERIKRFSSVNFMALVANGAGYERAYAVGVRRVRFTIMASNTFNQRNFNRTIDKSLQEFATIVSRAQVDGVQVVGVIGAAFGCPYETTVPPEVVLRLAEDFAHKGLNEIIFADTIGLATPAQVYALLTTVGRRLPEVDFGCHFHNTRNLGFSNVMAALSASVKTLDAAVGGIGGCPFAPSATGNIATEDLVHMMNGMGVATGIRLEQLISAAQYLEGKLGHTIPGQVMKAGPGLFGELQKISYTN